MKGFDYRTGLEVELHPSVWRAEMASAAKEGARRRVENGETFVHGSNGVLLFEAYGYLPPINVQRTP
jgi:hypothetical protein